jgi:2-keto-4-pentenoate hydratase/2-oxohepta-3-ene-1,7-dioic acid hydratase in catechol pathway
MNYLRFVQGGRARYGILNRKTVWEIAPDYFRPYKKTGKSWPLATVRLLAPCLPGKIVALGLNYRDHAHELNMTVPAQPLIFLKAPSAAIGPEEPIILPPVSRQVDYEGELAIVIKKTARNITARAARDYILGYTCFNDVTARDLQKTDGQWARAKSFDTFAPFGPWIVDGINPGNLRIETLVNGVVRQAASTADLLFTINEIVAFVAQCMTLLPGDIIATGTPPGIGPLQPGDRVQVAIQKIGTLTNPVHP